MKARKVQFLFESLERKPLRPKKQSNDASEKTAKISEMAKILMLREKELKEKNGLISKLAQMVLLYQGKNPFGLFRLDPENLKLIEGDVLQTLLAEKEQSALLMLNQREEALKTRVKDWQNSNFKGEIQGIRFFNEDFYGVEDELNETSSDSFFLKSSFDGF